MTKKALHSSLRRWLFCLAILVTLPGMVLFQAPGQLLDAGLRRWSSDALRLEFVKGSLWHGSGLLMIRGANDPLVHPWQNVIWNLDSSALWHGSIGWEFHVTNNKDQGKIELSPSGWHMTDLRWSLPAHLLGSHFPPPFSLTELGGEMQIETRSLRCGWRGECQGQTELIWRNAAGQGLLASARLGDYRLLSISQVSETTLQLDTLSGPLHAEGQGTMTGKGYQFSGVLTGSPELLRPISAIAGEHMKNSGDPGRWYFQLP
ncbi:MAG: type II secretion system protein N [Proteobacteria bacterium]|nr:type II secretion system protein N [Pseudomonadota bacterium]HQR02580.1 type II secretion system protein N [Rhodocyclaceae bacterium]